MSQKYRKFTANFKLQVIAAAEKTNSCQAAREFGVTECHVRRWKKSIELLKKMPSHKCANRGKSCKYPHLEKKIEEWVSQHRQEGIVVSRAAIRLYAINECRKEGIPEFAASAGWFTRFMKRNEVSFDVSKTSRVMNGGPLYFR